MALQLQVSVTAYYTFYFSHPMLSLIDELCMTIYKRAQLPLHSYRY
jgi:hypothetical protein